MLWRPNDCEFFSQAKGQILRANQYAIEYFCPCPTPNTARSGLTWNFVSLPHHHSLHEPHGKSKFVYFPNEGLISLVVAMMDGKTVEAGIVGKEGMAGTPAAVGLSRSPLREVVQSSVAGILQRMQTIEYIRGVVKIANRKKLDKFACECYAIIRQYNGEL